DFRYVADRRDFEAICSPDRAGTVDGWLVAFAFRRCRPFLQGTRVHINSTSFAAIMGLLAAVPLALRAGAESDDVAALVRQADEIKTADNSGFLTIVAQLQQADDLTHPQQAWLHYLQAWQLGYRGDYESALPALKAVIDEADDATLRFRADISLINDEALSA